MYDILKQRRGSPIFLGLELNSLQRMFWLNDTQKGSKSGLDSAKGIF